MPKRQLLSAYGARNTEGPLSVRQINFLLLPRQTPLCQRRLQVRVLAALRGLSWPPHARRRLRLCRHGRRLHQCRSGSMNSTMTSASTATTATVGRQGSARLLTLIAAAVIAAATCCRGASEGFERGHAIAAAARSRCTTGCSISGRRPPPPTRRTAGCSVCSRRERSPPSTRRKTRCSVCSSRRYHRTRCCL